MLSINDFDFREAFPGDGPETTRIESVCFSPEEACDLNMMNDRVAKAPEMFLIAVEKRTGNMAGFITAAATAEEVFRDEFFLDAGLHDPQGKNVMMLGLEVLPEYRAIGLSHALIEQFLAREKQRGRARALLTCHEGLVPMYEKYGFADLGASGSTWGGESWHDMEYRL